MADAEQLAIIKQGVDTWNEWRAQHIDAIIDLSLADLQGLELIKVNFPPANLTGANLSGILIPDAILDGANLTRVTNNLLSGIYV